MRWRRKLCDGGGKEKQGIVKFSLPVQHVSLRRRWYCDGAMFGEDFTVFDVLGDSASIRRPVMDLCVQFYRLRFNLVWKFVVSKHPAILKFLIIHRPSSAKWTRLRNFYFLDLFIFVVTATCSHHQAIFSTLMTATWWRLQNSLILLPSPLSLSRFITWHSDVRSGGMDGKKISLG